MADTKYYLDETGLETLVKTTREYYDKWRNTIRGYLDQYNAAKNLTTPYMFCAELNTITPTYVSLTEGIASGTASKLLGAYVLESINDSQSITSTVNLFNGCTNLYWCDLSNLDMSSITNTTNMFSSCSNLVVLRIKDLACDLDLSDCPLDYTSVNYIVKNLSNVSSATLTLSSTAYSNYLSSNLSATGWTVKQGDY